MKTAEQISLIGVIQQMREKITGIKDTRDLEKTDLFDKTEDELRELRNSLINPYNKEVARRKLEELRQSLREENISYGELTELQSLAKHIEPGDLELLEAAGVPEEEADKMMQELINTHEKIRNILIDYGNEEYGDCIIDEICEAVGIPPTTVYYNED